MCFEGVELLFNTSQVVRLDQFIESNDLRKQSCEHHLLFDPKFCPGSDQVFIQASLCANTHARYAEALQVADNAASKYTALWLVIDQGDLVCGRIKRHALSVWEYSNQRFKACNADHPINH